MPKSRTNKRNKKGKKIKGDLLPIEVFQKCWIDVPIERTKEGVAAPIETYLVPPRVADYIELLESKLEILPQLSNK